MAVTGLLGIENFSGVLTGSVPQYSYYGLLQNGFLLHKNKNHRVFVRWIESFQWEIVHLNFKNKKCSYIPIIITFQEKII